MLLKFILYIQVDVIIRGFLQSFDNSTPQGPISVL